MLSKESLQNVSHRRLNILTGKHVLCSPHRNKRPWQGGLEKLNIVEANNFDKDCYLCPGNLRAGGARNPDYKSTFFIRK